MHFSISLALGFIAASTSAHMIMTTPVPFGKSTLNNSPLLADGSDYPCKLRGTTFALESASNIMAAGSSQSLHFQGTAVHGGGSCQVSIAMLPSGATLSTLSDSDAKALNFKVIHSIVGGCPEQHMVGNSEDPAAAAAVDPSTYAFTIPDSVPAGNATLAWTWFNKVGNREMYMNCAPVTITSSTSTSKRSDADLQVRDTAAFSALPDMFTANIGNSCTTQDSKDVVFPNPGGSVASMGGSSALSATATPTGAGCQSAGSLLATGVVASAPSVASSAVASKASSSASASASASASSAGGVFVTTPASPSISVAAAKPTATPFSTAAAASPTSSTSATAAVAKTSSAAAAAAATTTTTTTTTSTSSSFGAMTPGSPCTTEGMFNCVSGTSFQQCASGTWSVVQSLADGTQCVVGQTMAIDITVSAKRGVSSAKFPRGHLRRHLGGGGN